MKRIAWLLHFVFTLKARFVKNSSLFFYLAKQHIYELTVCYMQFNNYFVESIKGDGRWGGGSSRKYWIKEGSQLLFTWSAGGSLQEF